MSLADLDGPGLPISAYSLILALGLGSGWLVSVLEARRHSGVRDGPLAWRVRGEDVLDAGLLATLGGLIGGRALIVALGWSYFGERPQQILMLAQGGLAWPGAWVGGATALAVYAAYRGLPLARLADALAPGVALGQALGWLGCLVGGCGYGLTTAGWLASELSDVYGIPTLRHAVQVYLSAWSALVFALLMVWPRPRATRGGAALLYLFLTSLGYFIEEFARGDETLFMGSLRYSQWVGAGLALLAAFGLLLLRREAPPAKGVMR